jgi:NAD(P)-dependent dehydrogenase (short-subunit alcohol dehydrogenase family)
LTPAADVDDTPPADRYDPTEVSVAGSSLDGRVALVTGAGSGIGEACAHGLAERGATVLIVDRDPEGAERVRGALVNRGRAADVFIGDLTDPDVCAAAVDHAVTSLGGLDIAVNNAGISGSVVPLDRFDVDEYRMVMATNVDTIFFCMRYELPRMLELGGGAIVNMASIFAVVARDNYPAYIASKHAVLGLTRSAALDYAPHNIRVNAVGPGVIRTAMLERYLDPELARAFAELHPMQRLGSPEEVANVVCWLASDEAAFVTGALYTVDGGFTAGVVTGIGVK